MPALPITPVAAANLPTALQTPAAVLALLQRWAASGWLRKLDASFAAFLAREVPDAAPLLILAAALTSHQLGRGHACLDLADTLRDPTLALSLPPEGMPWSREEGGAVLMDASYGSAVDPATATAAVPPLPTAVLAGIELDVWLRALDNPALVGNGPGNTPLVCSGQRVYLRRYWQHEVAVSRALQQRLAALAERQATLSSTTQHATLAATLSLLFPDTTATPSPNWQKIACALAARSDFSIITGGPGTGKTTTVVRLLALLQTLTLSQPLTDGAPAPQPLRIRLAAPTGKAAARLNESIVGAVAQLPVAALPNGAAVRAAIPLKVTTVHRLLGSRSDTRHFRHHAANPLPIDVLVIDEASMIDLDMMAAVLAALPPAARLILLGDKDQLASVEAGAVLGELCRRAKTGHYTPATRDWLAAVSGEHLDAELLDSAGTGLDQSVAMLRHSYRFSAHSGIGQLAKAVNAGNPAQVRAVLDADPGYRDLAWVPLSKVTAAADAAVDGVFRQLVIDGHSGPAQQDLLDSSPQNPQKKGYRHYLETLRDTRPAVSASQAEWDAWAYTVLQAQREFQLLTALRRGPWGVTGLNLRVGKLLHAAGLIPACDGWYSGRPVLLTRNDYSLGLMNGDIGITLDCPGPGQPAALRVAFPGSDGPNSIKWVLPSRLTAVETVYALTVHKAQGSEFVHAALVLPDALNPILTRELVYTGITRAQRWLSLASAGGTTVLEHAILRQVLRSSGLLAGLTTAAAVPPAPTLQVHYSPKNH